MKISWLIVALVVFIVGFILSINSSWVFFGISLIVLSIIILLIGLLMHNRRTRDFRRASITGPKTEMKEEKAGEKVTRAVRKVRKSPRRKR